MLDFTDDEIKKLKECFDSLDGDGSGSIGVKELEDPLIGLGFAESREEVQDLIRQVDDDGSGFIEFGEFLGIIKNSDGNEKNRKIYEFFKNMINNNIDGDEKKQKEASPEPVKKSKSKADHGKPTHVKAKSISKANKSAIKHEDEEQLLSFNLLV